jgi:hypothetical protein
LKNKKERSAIKSEKPGEEKKRRRRRKEKREIRTEIERSWRK